MPWMAARSGGHGTRDRGRRRTRRAISAGLFGLLLTIGLAAPAARADTQFPVKPVLLPDERDRALASGSGTWTASTQVTATGCGAGDCPAAAGAWQPATTTSGILRSSLTGAAGHAGQAVVTWRSGVFLAPPDSGRAIWTVSLAADHAWSASSTTAPIYTVRILNSALGTGRTVVDRAPVPAPGSGLGPAAPVALPAGSVVAGNLYRLEIAVRFALGAAAGDATVDLAAPTLTIEPSAVGPRPELLDVGPPTPKPREPEERSVDGPPPTEPPPNGPEAPVAVDRRCLDPEHDVAVIGVSAVDRRLTISGRAVQAAGTPVEMWSAEGWLLGRTALDTMGRFRAAVTEPRGSAGTRRVFARLADGSRSTEVGVQRQNVLGSAAPSGRSLVLRGVLAPGIARTGRFSAVVDLPALNPCTLARRVKATRTAVDRRTGRYRAVFALPQTARPTGSASSIPAAPALIRARLIRTGGGSRRAEFTSQVIFGPGSDRGES